MTFYSTLDGSRSKSALNFNPAVDPRQSPSKGKVTKENCYIAMQNTTNQQINASGKVTRQRSQKSENSNSPKAVIKEEKIESSDYNSQRENPQVLKRINHKNMGSTSISIVMKKKTEEN